MESVEQRRVRLVTACLGPFPHCKHCRGSRLQVHEVYFLQRFDRGYIAPGAPQLPVVPVLC